MFNPFHPLLIPQQPCVSTFFGKYTNTPSADQSTSLSALTNNDLQIGIGTADNTGSNVNFAAANMKHVNGLAKIVLGTKTIPVTRTFYITGINQSSVSGISTSAGGKTYDSKGIAAYMQYYQGSQASDPVATYKANSFTDADGNSHKLVEDGSTTKAVTAAANFNGTNNRPYYYSNQKAYYAIVKPSTSTVFYSADGISNGWGNRFTSNRISASVSKNSYGTYTAQSDSAFIFLDAEYNYAGEVEVFQTPLEGKYILEVWGASGNQVPNYYNMTAKSKMGKGGYVSGIVYKNKDQLLYLCIGGIPNGGSTTYNNGSDLPNFDAGIAGGGATSITTTNRGILKNFESYKNEVLLVGGGGGALEWNGYGGDGGYPQGESGTAFKHTTSSNEIGGTGTGGSQTYGGKTDNTVATEGYTKHFNGSFGQGGYGYQPSSWAATDYGAQGGGGWYGGGGASYAGAAGGGSSYYNSSIISNFNYQNGARTGNGKAIIIQSQ